MKAAPLCQVIQKRADFISRAVAQLVFDMKHEIAHIFTDNDSIGFQLAEILSQHLFGRSRNKPSELTQADRAGSHRAEYLHSPLTLEEHCDSKRSVASVSCIESAHTYAMVRRRFHKNYGANALAISILTRLVQSSLGSAAARAKAQSRRRSESTSAKSARRLIVPIGSA
jgi:hypothetical protein